MEYDPYLNSLESTIGLILGICVGIILIYTANYLAQQTYFNPNYVMGQVITATCTPFGTYYRCNLQVRFIYNTLEYVTIAKVSSRKYYTVGDTIYMYVNPDKPTDVKIDRESTLSNIVFALTLYAFAFCAIVGSIYIYIKIHYPDTEFDNYDIK